MKFLEIHYMHGSPRDADYNRDMQLPFKTAGECIPSLVTGYVPLLVQYALTPPSVLPVKKNYYTKELFTPSFYISNIWQPPKSC